MKIQLLKRTVKLPNRQPHILLLFQEKKTTCTNTPKGFRVAFNVKHFASFLRKYEIRLQKKTKTNANCSHIVSNEFL